jgi:hypothetical protein
MHARAHVFLLEEWHHDKPPSDRDKSCLPHAANSFGYTDKRGINYYETDLIIKVNLLLSQHEDST